LFPIDFQRRDAQERLQVEIDELAGGHLLALSNPHGLADQLFVFLKERMTDKPVRPRSS
jgi:hypothetical protein